jgi:drug/metabolite transporter (DMT)-like permease
MPRDDSTAPASVAPASFAWTAAAPAIFVVLWSTGFIAAKAGLPYAEPLTFLSWRFAFVTLLMLAASLVVRAPWPRRWSEVGHIAMVGLLMHGCYLGGVFSSIAHGFPAGLSALVVGLQPILTATVVGALIGERVSWRQWIGLLLGFGGVALVLAERYGFGGSADTAGFGWAAPALSVLALFGITAGTIYQKRFCAQANLYTGAVIQYAATFIPMAALAVAVETMVVEWSGPFIAAMAWLTLVLSVGTISLLYLLIRRGAVSKIASLFFLVPPSTALIAWALFGETLGPLALGGMAVAAIGVGLVQRG